MTAHPTAERTRAPDDHDHADGCLCGHDHADGEATHDHDLPAAEGGVEAARKPRRRATRTSAGEA
ncbi:hypothetical protein VQ02_21175 [Methylobacterium variabile]|uniref:Uncharacterized protein n=1 Tax=Methylobacterium variabile TaxID=298794 RepID=A0A0J6SI19_9HYPH|nr:hypothetical protein [Methylobacterium variabile]KMO33309.1 hypothetical protein VQ02_21175 [Methylobacterium variabile]